MRPKFISNFTANGEKAPAALLCFVLAIFSAGHGAWAASAFSIQRMNTSKIDSSLEEKPSRSFDGKWKFYLQGRDIRDEFNQSAIVLMRADFALNYHLAPWMILNAAPTLLGVTGHDQTETASRNTTSILFFRNATADLLFLENSRFQMGVANQLEVHSSLLMEDIGFPAARIQLRSLDKSYFQWGGFAQAAVPTSASLTTNSKEFEPTPSFNSGGVVLGLRSKSISWKNQLSLFEYRNLPMNVATRSGLLGNTVLVTNTTDAEFAYGYKGFEAISSLDTTFSARWSLRLSAAFVKNTEAPTEKSQASLIRIAPLYQINSKTGVSPFFQGFRIEPDSVVAYYNDDRLESNRVGYRTGLTLSFTNNFAITVAGGERALVFENPAQSRERFFDLGLETFSGQF
jgi:hypothetical protein